MCIAEIKIHGMNRLYKFIELWLDLPVNTWLNIVEVVFYPGQTLRMTDKKIAAIGKAAIQFSSQNHLCLVIKIDHDIAAKNNIKWLCKVKFLHEI